MAKKNLTPQTPGSQAQDAVADAPEAQELDAGLPAAADVDPTKIPRAVLTRDGWVVPAPSAVPQG